MYNAQFQNYENNIQFDCSETVKMFKVRRVQGTKEGDCEKANTLI